MCSQKRKAADDTDEDFQLPNGMPLPLWVSCMDSLNLYQEGVLLPDELKLSKAAARQVRRIREWAAQTNAPRMAQLPPDPRNPAGPAPSPPPTAFAQAVRPDAVIAAPSPWDPDILERVARLKNGPRVCV